MAHDEITAKINVVPDSRRPSHVHRADYATDAEYSAAKIAFYAPWVTSRPPYSRPIRPAIERAFLRLAKGASLCDPPLPWCWSNRA